MTHTHHTHTHRVTHARTRAHTHPTHTHLLSSGCDTDTQSRTHAHTPHSPTVSQAVTHTHKTNTHTLTTVSGGGHIHTYLAASAVCPSPNSIYDRFHYGCKVFMKWEFVKMFYGSVYDSEGESASRSLLSHSEHTLFAIWVTSSFCVCPSRWLVCVH